MSKIYNLSGKQKCSKYKCYELLTKMPGDTVSKNIVLAAKMRNIYEMSGDQKCLKYKVYELSTKMPSDTVSKNIVLAAKNEP